jgi:hypothetical protein
MFDFLTKKPWVLDKPTGNSHSDGYRLNIHEGTIRSSVGTRICQIPAFTWRSEAAVVRLGCKIAAAPVLIEAMQAIAAGVVAPDQCQDLAKHVLALTGLPATSEE